MNQPMEKCDVCGKSVPYGNHRYELRKNETYGIFICDVCREGNQDGWNQKYEEVLLNHIKLNDLPEPQRNKNQLLPYD